MKIEEIRNSFTVYLISTKLEKLAAITAGLGKAGYMTATFSELTAAFSEIFSNPPHIVILDFEESGFNLDKAVEQVRAQLPESHLVLVVPFEKRAKAFAYFEKGVYDLILTPLAAPVEAVKALDRAAERDYFMYLNESLSEGHTQVTAIRQTEEPAPVLTEDFHLEYARKLFEQTSQDDAIQVFMASASNALGGCPAVFFRYVANRRVLLASRGEKLEKVDLQGLGMDLNEAVDGFRAIQLREPMRLAPFAQMIKDVFSVHEFFAWPIRALGEVQGVVCFLAPTPKGGLHELLQEWMGLLEKAISLIEAEKRLHVVSIRDPATELLNRQTFLTKVNEEISRSRRTHLPTSLILIALDQFGQLSSLYGQEEAHLVLRMAGKILEKHSRVNDILGRVGVDEFGLLLAHTGKKGAMIKAERLRMMIESADFSKVLSKFPKLTVSVGISEYPELVRDGEELLQSADEALFQVRKQGNKTCIAKAPDGFEPDFKFEEKTP